MGRRTIVATRVSYGKKSTPAKLREYTVTQGGPVGTKAEWKEYADGMGADILFQELKKEKKLDLNEEAKQGRHYCASCGKRMRKHYSGHCPKCRDEGY